MTQDREYRSRQAVQEAEYAEPYHWDLRKRVEAARYRAKTRFLAELVAEAAPAAPPVVYDLGCGDGRGTYLLLRALESRGVRARLIGIDASAEAIRWAREKTAEVAEERLRFQEGDLLTEPIVDGGKPVPACLVLREVIEHFPRPAMRQMLRQLHPLGVPLVITTPTTNSPVPDKHFEHFTAATLRELLESCGYRVERLLGFEYRPAPLYEPLVWLKDKLNKVPVLWRLMNLCWRVVRPENAITLICVARPGAGASGQA